MISVEEARARIVADIRPLGAELVPITAAVGRVLARDVAARIAHPQADMSAMDGYAVRAADVATVPVTLPLVGQSAAGHPCERALGPGETIRIFTGAVVPEGADAVVIQEDTTTADGRVTITEPARPGRHIRPGGQDFRTGDVMMRAGRRLTFRDIGLAAALNIAWLMVYRQPRVAILSTGDEVRLPGDAIGPGDLIGSNGFALAAYVQSEGALATDLGVAADDRESLLALTGAAGGVDLLLTSGGVSVGDHDLVREVLGDAGMTLDFWKVAVRPGKPLMSGRLGPVPVIGLPGNPVSAMVGAVLFVQPVLAALQGLPATGPRRRRAVLGRDLPANDGREDYMRATLADGPDGAPVATPFERQDSAMLSTFAAADCLVIRPPNAPAASAGTTIEIIAFQEGLP